MIPSSRWLRTSRRITQVATATVLLHLLAAPLAAQRWSFGVLAGANRSTIAGSDVEGASSRNGVAGGAQLVRTLGDNVALEVNALYSIKGAKSDEGDGAIGDVRLTYLEIPLLLRIGPNNRGTIRPFATLGASASIRSACTAEVSGSGTSVSTSCGDLADFERLDAALIGGAGLDAPLGSGTMTLTVRYGYGVRNVVQDVKAQNRAFSVLAGGCRSVGSRPRPVARAVSRLAVTFPVLQARVGSGHHSERPTMHPQPSLTCH